jgi:hypothetical protein
MAPSLPSGKPHNHAYGSSRRRQGLGDQGGVTEMERGAEATGFEFERRRRRKVGWEGKGDTSAGLVGLAEFTIGLSVTMG